MNQIKGKTSGNSSLKPIGSFIYNHFKFVFCVIWFSFLIIQITQWIRRDLRDVVVWEMHHEFLKKDFNLDHKLNKLKREIMSTKES